MRALTYVSYALVALALTACSADAPTKSKALPRAALGEPSPQPPDLPTSIAEIEPAAPIPDLPSAKATQVVDLLKIRKARARIVALFDVRGPPCGVLHTVGAIEVELLDLGEPAPRLGLYISCPTDLQPHGILEVGRVLDLRFHKRKQSWPRPVKRPPENLVLRYVSSIKLVPDPSLP